MFDALTEASNVLDSWIRWAEGYRGNYSLLNERTYLYAKMSAACKIGYVNNPLFSIDSSTSDSLLALRDTANLL